MEGISILQGSVGSIISELEGMPIIFAPEAEGANEEAPLFESSASIVTSLMSDIVKEIRKLVDNIKSGSGTSEDYLESTCIIAALVKKLLSKVDQSGSNLLYFLYFLFSLFYFIFIFILFYFIFIYIIYQFNSTQFN